MFQSAADVHSKHAHPQPAEIIFIGSLSIWVSLGMETGVPLLVNLMRHLKSCELCKTEQGLPQHPGRRPREFAVKSETACQKQVPYQTLPMMASAK